MTSLTLKMFGDFQAYLDDQLIDGFRTTKVQALLVYLAVESERHGRESVMELLWPGMPERSARHNLRQILYNLRGAIPDLDSVKEGENQEVQLLVTNRSYIGLNQEADVQTDVDQFEALLEKIQGHDHVDLVGCSTCKGDLETAVSIYKGEFLADFYLVDSNEFEDWAQMTRQAYRRKALDALEVLTSMAIRQKDYPDARRLAESQLEIDNLRESSYRQLMEVLALSGQREEALSVYESCRRLLAEELGMKPASRTTEVYELIRAGELSFDSPRQSGIRGYELKEEIGAGSHGTIYRAIQPDLGREVAVKVVHRKYANDPEFVRRFEDEAQIIARLEHPYVVPLYDYWRDAEGTFLIMRHLRGGNLLSKLVKGPWNGESTVKMMNQLTAALATAHSQGIVHRDIKPANILFDELGNAYLSDFSIAKRLEGGRKLTAAGAMVGTPDYISPEQIMDERVSALSDLYSLGAVLYETLTGEKPFGDSSVANLIYKHINEPFPLVSDSRPDLPAEIDGVIQKATAKRPSDRYRDALEMAEAVQAALGGGERPITIDGGFETAVELYNPFKGLRPFQELDTDDFFGRDALVDRLVSRLATANSASESDWENGRFVAVVGPSGSGKSSAIKAGLIPALRAGALPGSDKWFVVEMVPGTHPLEELELALWPVAVDPPPSLVEPMERDVRGMLRTIRRILPETAAADGAPQLLIVIDQFEELFTLVEDEARRSFFLDSLIAAISAPRSPVRVVVTLRADFYDRPLQYQRLGQLIKHNTELVLPMTSEELTWAIREPARRVGIRLEEGLSEAIIADVADQAGGLPLLQYAMTELFERRQGKQLMLEAYQEIGGVKGALGRRAEALFRDLDGEAQEMTRQVFLRLVTLGEGVEDTRRRVLRSELEAITAGSGDQSENLQKLRESIDKFGAARLLTFDRDALTRSPTVEVAHEALLRQWPRLREWLAESRNDVRSQRLLAGAAAQWLEANKDESYLLQGARLAQYEGWAATSRVGLTDVERRYLAESIGRREYKRAEEESRRQQELETAQRLAETEKARAEAESLRAEAESLRAEEQRGAARRLRRFALLLAGVLLVAFALAFLAFQSSREAEQFAKLSQSRELAAAANNNLDSDPELSILLALEAININHTTEAENALHEAILASRLRQRLNNGNMIIERVAYSPDGDYIVSASRDNQAVMIWAPETGRVLHTIPMSGCCLGLYFDERANRMAIVERESDFTIGIFEIVSGKKVASYSLPFFASDAYFFALDHDWEKIAVSLEGGTAEVWDLENGEKLFDLPGHENYVEVEFTRDGRYLVSYDWPNGRVIVWDTETGEALRTVDTGIGYNDHAISPDGRWLALTSGIGTNIEIWDLNAMTDGLDPIPSITLFGHESPIFLLAFSQDSQLLASASRDGKANVYDVITGQEQFVLQQGANGARSVAFHPTGDKLLTGDFDGNIRVWDLTIQGSSERLAIRLGEESASASFNSNGSLLATGTWDSLAQIWDPQTGELKLTLEGHSDGVLATAFHPTENQLATASNDTTVRIWDTLTGEELMILDGHQPGDVGGIFKGVLDLAYSPDGSTLVTAGTDGTLRFWDSESGEQVGLIEESSGLTSVAYSKDGRYLAYGVDMPKGAAVVLDAQTFEEIITIRIELRVSSLDFSPDGRFLVTSGGDPKVRIWSLDYSTGRANQATELESHSTNVLTVAFSGDGRYLASATRAEVRLWDVSGLTSEREDGGVTELLVLEGGVGTAFSPDVAELISGGLEQLMRVYVLDGEALIALAKERLTRNLTDQECQRYLHIEACPEE